MAAPKPRPATTTRSLGGRGGVGARARPRRSRSRDEVADILRATLGNGRRLRAEAIKRNR